MCFCGGAVTAGVEASRASEVEVMINVVLVVAKQVEAVHCGLYNKPG